MANNNKKQPYREAASLVFGIPEAHVTNEQLLVIERALLSVPEAPKLRDAAGRLPFANQEQLSNTNQIRMFFVCALCLQSGVRPDIEAGWTRFGVQVWCRVHDVNMIHIDFMGAKLPADMRVRGKKLT